MTPDELLTEARWRLWPRQYRRVAAFADSTMSADVRQFAVSVVTPSLLALDVSGLPEVERHRVVRQTADRAVRQLPRVSKETSPDSKKLTPDIERTVELRSRFRAMKLTTSQQRVADAMLRLGTVRSDEVAEELGIRPTTVRRHRQAIRLAASTAG